MLLGRQRFHSKQATLSHTSVTNWRTLGMRVAAPTSMSPVSFRGGATHLLLLLFWLLLLLLLSSASPANIW
jgi:hypothetical protein